MCRVLSGAAVTDEEIQATEEKFNESRLLAEVAMRNLLENDVRHYQRLPYLFPLGFFCSILLLPAAAGVTAVNWNIRRICTHSCICDAGDLTGAAHDFVSSGCHHLHLHHLHLRQNPEWFDILMPVFPDCPVFYFHII